MAASIMPVEYSFTEPREVSGAEVYWFDDSSRAGK